MSKNISEIPYTELVERAQQLARVSPDTLYKIRGLINDVYAREIPAKFDWNFLLTESSFQTVDEYHANSITMNTGDTTVQGIAGEAWVSGMAGRKFKPANNDTIYDITVFTNASTLTINPSLQGASNLSGASYSIFQPYYTLAGDFDRFPKPGGVYRWAGGKKQILPEDSYRVYIEDDFQVSASTPSKTRLFGTDTLGQNQVVELIPAPRTARNYGYYYYKKITPMFETTAGTLSAIAGGVNVTGNGTNFTMARTGDYFRVTNYGKGQDSTWYIIAGITHDSALTLKNTFAESSITAGANYAISRAPEMPARLHAGILYGALRGLVIDQDDPNAAFYNNAYAQVLSDAKKIYVSRPYSQEVTGVFEDYRYRR